jgi:predicted AlkP superfamily pyrophosphatase or phosphodiesterase
MSRIAYLFFALIGFIFLVMIEDSYGQTRTGAIPAKDRIVVVISIDGFPAYAFDDLRLPTPTLLRLAREGVRAQGMKIVNPAVTWPNHTSMITGVAPAKHSVLFNGLLVRDDPKIPPKVEPWRDKEEMVKAPTVYDLAFRAGLTTAQVDWVAITNPKTITWEFAERPNVNGHIEKEMIEEGTVKEKDLLEFGKASSVWRDEIWTNAAAHIIKKHKPNLLLFHLLNTDSTHHRYGPNTPAGTTALAYADTRVQQILDALKTADLLERATVLIVSDHGFKTAKRNIRPNTVLREKGLLIVDGNKVTSADAYVIPEGGTAMVYVTDPANRQRLVPQLKEWFKQLEGVDRILGPEDFPALGLPDPEKNKQMADLVLAGKEGYSFGASTDGAAVVDIGTTANPGNHGYLNSDPEMTAIFIAWGYGITPGSSLPEFKNVDIAPTIALLLGLKMKDIDGAPLHTILKSSALSAEWSPKN